MPRNALLLLGRLLLAALFLPSGLATLSNLDGAASYFAGLGLPLPTLAAWGAGLFETAAGVLILIGCQTPIAALLLALFAAFAGFVGHFGQGGEDATLGLCTARHLEGYCDCRRAFHSGRFGRGRLFGRLAPEIAGGQLIGRFAAVDHQIELAASDLGDLRQPADRPLAIETREIGGDDQRQRGRCRAFPISAAG